MIENQKSDLTILLSFAAPDWAIEKIKSVCPQADVRSAPWTEDEEQTMDPALMRGVDVYLCEYPAGNFDDFDSLKFMQISSAGYSQILGLPLVERGIRVANGLGNFDVPIAEWNIMMILMWHRHMLEMLQNQEDKSWDRDTRFQAELRGSRIGFYGYGGIARETTRLAKAMGLEVWVMTRDGSVRGRDNIYRVEETGDSEGQLCDRVFAASQKEEFLSQLDYFILSLPLVPATEGIIGQAELKMMKASSVLINPARAQLVPCDVLLHALQEGWIRGASFDVHYAYPLPADHPLWTQPNIILTPHISGSNASPYTCERLYEIFTNNLERLITGKPLLNELSKAQLNGQ